MEIHRIQYDRIGHVSNVARDLAVWPRSVFRLLTMDSGSFDAYDVPADPQGTGHDPDGTGRRVPGVPAPRALATEAVHAGRDDLARQGVHAPPIDLSTTYPSYDSRGEAARIDAFAADGAEPEGPPSTAASATRPSLASRPPSRVLRAPRARSRSPPGWPL